MSIKKEKGDIFHSHHHDDHHHSSSTAAIAAFSSDNPNNTDYNNDVAEVTTIVSPTPPEKPKHVNIPPPILINKTSADAGDFNDIYMPSPSLRYMPVELVGSSSVKLSIAKGLLSHALGRGVSVKKFGRQGKPKRKRLFCNPQVTVLMWQAETVEDEEETKDVRFINISDIKSIRLGTEIDPITTETALQHALEFGEIHQSDYITVQEIKQKEGIVDKPGQKGGFLSSFFMGGKEKDVVLYGTAILRRSCKPEEMKLCISFILEDRTFDIQCFNQRDLDTLRINLNELISNNVPKTMTEKPPSLYIEANDNPLMAARKKMMSKKAATKKSVRFSTDTDDVKYDTNNGKFDQPNIELGIKSSSGDSGDVMYLSEGIENLDKLVEHSNKSTSASILQQMQSAIGAEVDGHENHAKTTAAVVDSNSNTNGDNSSISMTSIEALQIGLILSEQEKMYGTNMYESLQPSDEAQIARYVAKGYTAEEAIMRIFEKKFVPKHEMRLAHMSRTASEMNASISKVKVI